MTTRYGRAAAVAIVVALAAAPATAQIFTDMANHPARQAAERLAAKGIVTRLPDGRFAPNEPLSRLDLAVFLGRSLGVPSTGLRPLEFRDTDQIPPEDRAAVAAASVMGTVSSTRAEVRKGQVLYTLTTDKKAYAPGEEIQLTFTIANVGPGRETELLSPERGRARMRLGEREGVKPGYEGELYVESQTPQGRRRETVARVRVAIVRQTESVLDVVAEGTVQMRPGLKVFYLPDVWFEYATTQFHDFIVRDSEGNEVARWSLNRPFQAIQQPVPLAANQEMRFQSRWRQLDQNDQPARPGRYEIVAMQTTKDDPTTVGLTYQRGLVTAFPDNTFRPRQPVTRVELAAFGVRAMGLDGEAARAGGSLVVADARDIPPDLRGAVAVAIERKFVPALPDNSFRPGQTATRGDAIIVLNAMMEALGRYDYTVGTLREVRGGPPPVVVVEGEDKQLRTHRVAPVSAIYRGGQPVVLIQLRPGDQLKMLKPTDAGLVMYIEAQGR
jgi:hypothetical protein